MLPDRGLRLIAGLLAGTLVWGGGCTEGGRWGLRKLPPEPTPQSAAVPDAVLADTIGAQTLIGEGEPLRLRGFGVVVGLGEDGGSDCPTTIREYLLEYFARETAPRGTGAPQPRFAPERLLDSLDTAVVAVHGLVPGGAPGHTRFDLQVEAIGTQTRSLEGGVLLPCELRRFDASATGRGLVAGQTLARGGGLIFTNPFQRSGESATQPSLRQGYVLGGGRTLEDRSVRLLLEQPSYWQARRIQSRLNERFGQDPPAAEAMSRGYLTLTTPAPFAECPDRFIALATHLCLENTPASVERKLIELAQELEGPERKLDHISLVWEGMGRTAIAHIQPLYTHADLSVRFYAARAGLRLNDVTALATMAQIAATPGHQCRLLAVRELGRCEFPQAARHLAGLLDSDDQEVRIAAYEGLLRRGHPAIESRHFPSALDPTQLNLTLDMVESNGKPLIYVRRTLEPRIAVFGRQMRVAVPVFYNHPQDLVTLNALEEDGDITVLARTRSGSFIPQPLVVPARVAELIQALAGPPVKDNQGQFRGLGLDYSHVVEVLDALCASGTIPARLVLEQASVIDLLGPAQPAERLEGDQTPPLPKEWPETTDEPDDRTGRSDSDGQRPE